jgi:hypothetical protein
MTLKSKRPKPATMTEHAAARPTMPATVSIDADAGNLVRQAVVDSLAALPPAARHAASEFFRGILPRIVVIAEAQPAPPDPLPPQ